MVYNVCGWNDTISLCHYSNKCGGYNYEKKKNTKRTRVEVLKQADGIKKDKSDTAAKERGYLYIHSCTAIFTASASLILILMVQSVHLFAVSSAFYMVYCANHRGNQGLGC